METNLKEREKKKFEMIGKFSESLFSIGMLRERECIVIPPGKSTITRGSNSVDSGPPEVLSPLASFLTSLMTLIKVCGRASRASCLPCHSYITDK